MSHTTTGLTVIIHNYQHGGGEGSEIKNTAIEISELINTETVAVYLVSIANINNLSLFMYQSMSCSRG